MKCTIDQSQLYPLLQSVARSCGVKAQLPVLGNILFAVSGSKLLLSATNLEIGVVKSVSIEPSEDGDITVPARTILELVANLSGEKIELVATADQLTISTPNFSSQINGIPASEFPNIPLAGEQVISIEPEVLLKSVPEVAFAAAVDEGRPTLTGIYTEIKGQSLQLVSTDGFRLAVKELKINGEANFKALIPRRTFEEVLRLINEDEADQVSISISEDQNQIVFNFGTTEVSSRLIEGQFPAWDKIIPTQAVCRIVLEKAAFLKAVKLASVFARSESNVIKLQSLEDKISLLSEAKEVGNQKNEVMAQVEGEQLSVAFNAKYLLDALNGFNSHQLIIELSGNLSAAMIKPMGEDGLRYIIMPVNLG